MPWTTPENYISVDFASLSNILSVSHVNDFPIDYNSLPIFDASVCESALATSVFIVRGLINFYSSLKAYNSIVVAEKVVYQ